MAFQQHQYISISNNVSVSLFSFFKSINQIVLSGHIWQHAERIDGSLGKGHPFLNSLHLSIFEFCSLFFCIFNMLLYIADIW